jgi:hypothetical protein
MSENIVLRDENTNFNSLKIIEMYEDVVKYLYPICINMSKGHMVLRNKILDCMFNQIELFIQAGKTNQISKLYLADSNMSLTRFYLRLANNDSTKLISSKQFNVLSLKLSDIQVVLDKWIKSSKSANRDKGN